MTSLRSGFARPYWTAIPLAILALASIGRAQSNLTVYHVASSGASPAEATTLAGQLGIPASELRLSGGAIEFVDTSRYLALPKAAVPNSPFLQRAIAATKNKDSARPITPTVLNANAIRALSVVPDQTALAKTAAALQAASLTPQFGKPGAGHHEISLFLPDSTQPPVAESTPIDTEVAYEFTDPAGYPIVGPGAQAQVSFDPSGHVSRLYYAERRLTPAGTVSLIPEGQIFQEIAGLFPGFSSIRTRLVYYAPPLSTSATFLIPYYAYSVTTNVINPATGAVAEAKPKVGFLPATADLRFVPAARLSAQGGSTVTASVSVEGGRPPYRYVWGGSSARSVQPNSSTISYVPTYRASQSLLTDPGFSRERNESLSVTVIDANGVSVVANDTVSVVATPFFPTAHNEALPTYGSENPANPLRWLPGEIAWNTEMGTPLDGATFSFDWDNDSAWPGDMIRPTPAATLVPTPWVFGDADYSNWGIDAADIVLDNADGWPDGTVFMQPGAPPGLYPTSDIWAPIFSQDVDINLNGFGVPQSFTVPYAGSWGPVGPNDTLEWLLLDDCDMLDLWDEPNNTGFRVDQRWGPAFGGLHVLTGFASLDYGNGPFEGGVADNIMGIGGPAETILQGWMDSASATGAGNAAGMGPVVEISPGIYICDSDDSFWGKGWVGPTLLESMFPPGEYGYWYMTSTTPMQNLF